MVAAILRVNLRCPDQGASEGIGKDSPLHDGRRLAQEEYSIAGPHYSPVAAERPKSKPEPGHECALVSRPRTGGPTGLIRVSQLIQRRCARDVANQSFVLVKGHQFLVAHMEGRFILPTNSQVKG